MWPVESLQRLLGIEHPIIQAPMGGAVSPALVATVSNAGGLGMLPGISATPDRLRAAIRATRERTDKVFGVNLVFKDDVDPLLDTVLGEAVPIVSFFWGDPAPFVDRVHGAGAIVMHTIGSAREARRSLDRGTDVVVAQGWEAGGHVWGTVSTMALVPAVVEVAGTAPVVAAGGIADGRGIVAALALGAAGVWIGTRFLAAAEATIHQIYRDRLFAAAETDTLHTTLYDQGWPDAPHRVLRNATTAAWEAAGRPRPGERPGERDIVARAGDGSAITRYAARTPHENFSGDIEALPMWAGQGVSRINRLQSTRAILDDLVSEATTCLARLVSTCKDHQ
jgi:nitronate monooxygenase